ncbi:hypothetical protein M3I01_008660 [Marinomonas sp. RSW2]|uniref:Uncharacterized protein n=1 Tax=Marinomonas maritima TaxID=2940935 RepID=A0ABT5WDU8_9GAMM|nr:hypothetical protein [Marinomonas maritima]MDE8602994.1 hypothetical protein [Marinomonas maritima]
MDEEKELKEISDLRWGFIDKVFKSKKEDFKSRYPLDSIYDNAAALSAYGSRTPDVFQYLLTLLEADIDIVSISAKGAIVSNAFALSSKEKLSSKAYYTSQSVEDLFDISFGVFFKSPSVGYVKIIVKALYCWELDNVNRWCTNKKSNQEWFSRFDNLDNSFKGLKKETIRFVNSKS